MSVKRKIEDYLDIIQLPHPTSKKHPRMAQGDRAAQFAPFAALTGYNEAIKEAGRMVDQKVLLSEEEKSLLNDKLNYLIEHRKENIPVSIEYFEKDLKKDGGAYHTVVEVIKKVDILEQKVILQNGLEIEMDNLKSIQADLWD